MAVFPDRIVLKNSTDDQATIEAAIGAGGTDEIAQGEIVVGVNPTDAKFYTKAGDGSIVSLGGTGTGATTLGELSDVDLSTPATDGQVIAYNTTSGNWEPVSQSGGAGYTDPLTTDGDIVIRSSGVTTRLGIGTSGQVLTVTGGIPSWENATGGGATTTLDLTDVTGVPLVEYSFTQDAGTSSIGSALVNFQDYGAPGSFEKYQIYISQTEQGGGQDFWAWIQANLIPGDSNATADIYVNLPGMTSAQLATAYLSVTYPNAYVLELPRNVGQNPDQADWLGAYFPLTDGVSEISFVPGNSAGAYGDEGMVMRSNGRVIGGFSVASLDVNDLGDVDTSTNAPTDGQVLTWVDANNQWEPADAVGGGGNILPSVSGWTINSDSTAATSQVLDAPTHSAGDLLVACIMSRNSGGTLTPPSGFVLHGEYLSSIAFSGDVQTISVFTKAATGSEPATYTWTQANSGRFCGFIAAVDGNAGISTVTENYGNGTTATINTVANRLNLTAATWVYAKTTEAENYSQSGASVTEITDSPVIAARISGGYTTEAGTVTSTHDAADTANNPNHGMINIQLEVTTSISDSTDVDTVTTPPTDGQVLTWVDANSQWEPASTSIDDLTDVDTASVAPTNGQVLKWDGTNWVPADVTGGGAIATTPAPSGPADTGTAGEIKYDADYIYLAVATNTWKRAALSTWVPA